MWKDDRSGQLTALGQACKDATILLLKYFIFRAVNRNSDAEKQKNELMNKYLSREPSERL
jgi:hypothetical protein